MTSPLVHLSKNEAKLRDFLLMVCSDLRKIKPESPPVTMRLAGGWVRDKLLLKESDDLDIALDTMTGFEFASEINAYSSRHGLDTHKVAKIVSNPDKSKHLETATMRIFEQDVDFVNLRSEEYDETSRIPVMSFGTPLQDALRRDITINALFYNLHTQQVEDLTEKGLSDLGNGIIRTPLPPYQTFIEDPLRILRVIRFASRFGYSVHKDITEAVCNDAIVAAFDTKISRERIGVEVDKIWKGPDVLRGVRLLDEFNFYHHVFKPPSNDITFSSKNAIKAVFATQWLLHSPWLPKLLPTNFSELSSQQKRMLNMTATVLPFGKQTILDSKKKEVSVAKWVIGTSIKLSSVDADVVSEIVSSIDSVRELVSLYSTDRQQVDRKMSGLLIRKLGGRPLLDDWPMVVLLAAASDIMHLLPSEHLKHSTCLERVSLADIPRYYQQAESCDQVKQVLTHYADWIQYVNEQDLSQVHKWKPLLNGKQVSQLLSLKPGPHVGLLLDKIMEWQLESTESIFSDENMTPTPEAIEKCKQFIQLWVSHSANSIPRD